MPVDFQNEGYISSETLLAVSINKQEMPGISFFLETSSGELLANSTDIERWRLVLPLQQPIVYRDQTYYPLSAFEGLTYYVNRTEMRIDIQVPSQAFAFNHLSAADSSLVDPTPSTPGGFLNYDLNGQQSVGEWQAGGVFEAGFFNGAGIALSDFLIQGMHATSENDSNNNNPTQTASNYQATRLNTNWRHDNPAKMRTTILGDSYNATGIWGRSVSFGGLQWGTNFGTQPAFITFPLPSTKGEALVPTVVDLYVNNSLVSSNAVPPGPFSMNYIPVVTGQGNVSVVTTDLLGRQEVVDLPYYASNQLLRKGLQDFSYETGFIRQNFGIASNDYSQFMMTGTHRLGVTDNFTGELHGEVLSSSQTLGMGGNYLWSDIGVFNAALAGSIDYGPGVGTGALASVGFQRQTFSNINFGFNTQATSSQFTQLGFQDDTLPPALINQVFVGIPLQRSTSIGVTYTLQNNRDDPDVSFVNASVNKSLGDWSFGLTMLLDLGGEAQNGVFLTLAHTINSRTTLNLGGIAQENTNQGFAQLTRNLPVGSGFGYNLLASPGDPNNYQATLSAQNRIGTYNATVVSEGDNRGYRLDTQGSAIALDKQIYLTRRVTDSFSVVQVPGYPNVDVYENNQLVGHTDKNGNALVPDLLSYQGNMIRIDENQLPMDAEIDTTEINVIPYHRSGVLVRFPVKPAHAATFTLVQSSGEPIPVGAIIRIVNQEKEFPVGQNGVAYVTGLEKNTSLNASWDDQQCRFYLQYPETTDPLPDLGTIQCI